jgi:hypothetical protein
MLHVGASPLCNGFYIPFSHTILMMGTDIAKTIFLALPLAVCFECCRRNNPVV